MTWIIESERARQEKEITMRQEVGLISSVKWSYSSVGNFEDGGKSYKQRHAGGL